MICRKCKSNQFYILKDNHIKCKKCFAKYSLNKLERDKKIIEKFCEDKNVLQASNELKYNYKTVKKRYDILRNKISLYLEEVVQNSIGEYDFVREFHYIPQKYKNKSNDNKDKIINIVAFSNGRQVYTLFLPNRGSYYNTIDSLHSYKSNLNEFWNFAIEYLKRFKGIDKRNFFPYLKECEFKFNYTKQEQMDILTCI